MLDDDVRRLLTRANFVHVATVLPDGGPHSVAVWANVEDDGRIGFFTQPGSRKARNLAADPRVAISVVDHDEPYKSAQIRGRVMGTIEGRAALEWMNAVALRYTSKPWPYMDGTGLVFLVEPERTRYTELPFEHEPARD